MEKVKGIVRSIVELCISVSWILIHISTMAEIAKMDISSSSIRGSFIIMGISGIGFPLYLLWIRYKEIKKRKGVNND